jgi:octaprenyl-diphosphate synthase
VLAAVVEMIHTATLVHDDVLDEADMRRHLATVNARWDHEASVLLGDFLFTHAFYLASTLQTTRGCELIGRATNAVCEGEIRQKGSRADFAISEDEYLQILSAKTGELCACCCQLGAHFAGGEPSVTERMANYGRNLGVAFQIADDLLDLEGDEQTVGKSLGTDLDKQKPTLPIIRALQVTQGRHHQQLLAILRGEQGDGRLQALRPFLEGSDATGYARTRARHFAGLALQQLSELPENASLRALRQLTDFVVDRAR